MPVVLVPVVLVPVVLVPVVDLVVDLMVDHPHLYEKHYPTHRQLIYPHYSLGMHVHTYVCSTNTRFMMLSASLCYCSQINT